MAPQFCAIWPKTAKEYGVDHRIRFGCKVARVVAVGYVERAKDLLFKQGSRKPWRMNQNYALDVMALRFSAIDDGALEFRRRETGSHAA